MLRKNVLRSVSALVSILLLSVSSAIILNVVSCFTAIRANEVIGIEEGFYFSMFFLTLTAIANPLVSSFEKNRSVQVLAIFSVFALSVLVLQLGTFGIEFLTLFIELIGGGIGVCTYPFFYDFLVARIESIDRKIHVRNN